MVSPPEPRRPTGDAVAMPGDDSEAVQAALEEFIDRHAAGERPDPAEFAARQQGPLRARILGQIRQFLQFDGFVGEQNYSTAELQAPQGRQFGDFVIQEELGRGGMGIVYLAHQSSLRRRVALKVMQSGLSLSKRHVERFRREASAAAQLRHPGIVPVHSFCEVDGTLALAMDYVAGRNLADILDDLRLRNGQQPGPIEGSLGIQPEQGYVAECALLCAQVADALAAAHQAGIAHRDLKPRNLMVDDARQARLLDFGLAKSLGEGSISMSGEITGTAHYMSPEQTLAKRVSLDHRTDIFSLGVILYELLTLRRPFDGRNLQQIVYEICFAEPTPIHRQNPKVPRDLITICMKAMEKDPNRRYQTAAAMAEDLRRFLGWEPILARPAGTLSRIGKWIRRHRAESAAIGIGTAVLVGVLAVQMYRGAEDRRRSGELLQQAERAADGEDFETAIQRATEALALQPDDPTIPPRLELIQEKRTTRAVREQRDVAEANRLLAKSKEAQETDRELALLLALEAVQLRDSPEARSAVLQALGSGYHVTTLDGHQGSIYMARFDGLGRRCATAGTDGVAIVWDVASGQVLQRLHGHEGWVVGVAFQPAGGLLATAGQDRSARLWDTSTGRCVSVLAHEGTVDLVQWDQSGQRLLTTSNRYENGPFTAQVWDLRDPAQPRRLGACPAHSRLVGPSALAPDGATVASYGDPGFVRLWRADDGVELARLPHDRRVTALAFAADGARVAVASENGAVRVFAVPDGSLVAEVRHSRRVEAVAFQEGGGLLTAGADHTARLWSLERGGVESSTLTGHGGPVGSAAFGAGGRYVVTGSDDRKVRLFDPATGAELARYEVGQAVKDATLDPDARRALLVAGGQRALLWDLTDTHGTITLRHPSYVRDAFFGKDGEHVATLCDDEIVRLWNARSGQLVRTITGFGDPVLCGAMDPAGERLVAGTSGGEVIVSSVWDGQQLFRLQGHRGKVNCARFAAAGNRLVTCGQDGAAIVWNANDRASLARIDRGTSVLAADLGADGRRLLTVDDKATEIQLWSVPDGRPLGTLRGHTGPIASAVFDPTGELVLSASEDNTARITRAADGEVVRVLTADRPLRRAAFSADGSAVLTCGSSAVDHLVQLWDARTGVPLLRYAGHHGRIAQAAFSPDGAWAISASMDRTARIWPTDPVAVARRLSLRPLTDAERTSLDLPSARAGR